MQPHGQPGRSQTVQLTVDPRLGLVESASRGQRQPLRETTHGAFVGEPLPASGTPSTKIRADFLPGSQTKAMC